jgi:hypothetical protein
MGLRDRIRRLQRESGSDRWDLVCPECGWEVTLYGDVPIDLLVYDWEQGYTGETYGPPPHPLLVELAEHEHPANNFVDKTSELNIHHPSVSGINLTGDAFRGE